MSITPTWYSTMFTLIFLMGQMLSAFSFTVLWLSILIRYEPVHGKISMDQFNDLGSFHVRVHGAVGVHVLRAAFDHVDGESAARRWRGTCRAWKGSGK
jgi:hypothetical protein